MSDSTHARRTAVQRWYNDKDVSAQIADMLVSLEYTDFASGQVNDLQVTIKDPDRRWRRSWYPDSGARLRAKLVQTEGPTQYVLDCGEFVIDKPVYRHPGIITLKATSASIKTSLRREAKTRRWQNATLAGLVEQIANEQGVKIILKGGDAGPIAKADQKDESDLAFLLRMAEREGYALKIADGGLIIYPRAELDGADPVATIDREDGTIIDYSFGEDDLDRYRACKVVYRHPDKKLLSAIYPPEGEQDSDAGPVIRKRLHCGSQSEALRAAKAYYELANRDRRSASIVRRGDVRLRAGVTVDLTGWDRMDGRYALDQVTHTVGGEAYENTLKSVRLV